MKPVSLATAFGVICIFFIIAAGCVAPPKATSGQTSSYYTGSGTSANVTPTPNQLVTEETAFVTQVPASTGTQSPVFAVTTTPVPADQSCLIYSNTADINSVNTTAVSFNLKNPPMYITYSVIPFNITRNRVFSSRTGDGSLTTLTYSDYADYSWFEVTVMNKTTGKVYLDDGFGRTKGYNTYLNATLKVLNTDNMLVQFHANNISATYGIWVKPVGNIDDPENTTFAQCKYWTGAPQNVLMTATATPTPTWTS